MTPPFSFSLDNALGSLHCGDYRKVISDRQGFSLILTSPPYNIGSDGPAKTYGLRRFGVRDPKSYRGVTDYADSLPEDVYQQQQHDFLLWCSQRLLPGGVVAYNHKYRRKHHCLISPESWFPKELTLADCVIWDRRSTHNHDRTQLYPHTEFIYILKRAEDRRYYFDNSADEDSDSRCNLWRIPRESKTWHNAAFPLKLAVRIVRKWSPPGGWVCDPYAGSGTTLVACLVLRRNSVGAERRKAFFSKCVERLNKYPASENEQPPIRNAIC